MGASGIVLRHLRMENTNYKLEGRKEGRKEGTKERRNERTDDGRMDKEGRDVGREEEVNEGWKEQYIYVYITQVHTVIECTNALVESAKLILVLLVF